MTLLTFLADNGYVAERDDDDEEGEVTDTED